MEEIVTSVKHVADIMSEITPVLAFNKADLYLACNRAVPDALIEKLNAALAAMNRDGTTKALERKYEHWPD